MGKKHLVLNGHNQILKGARVVEEDKSKEGGKERGIPTTLSSFKMSSQNF